MGRYCYGISRGGYSTHRIVVTELGMGSCDLKEVGMAILHLLPIWSAFLAGAGGLMYMIYRVSEFHESARPRRSPRE